MIEMGVQNGPKIATTQELLASLQGVTSKTLLSNFRTTVDHISRCLQVPKEQLTIEALIDVTPALRADLEQRRYKRSSVRSYCKFAQMLLSRAKELGWTPSEPDVPAIWQQIFDEARKAGVKDIVRYAIKRKIAPSDFTERDLDAWIETMASRGRTYTTAHDYKTIFKGVVRNCGLAEQLPGLSPLQESRRYAIRLSLFPAQLRDEVENLLAWKQADFAAGRPKKCRHRAVTAEGLKSSIEQLYGFATQIKPTITKLNATSRTADATIVSLADLVTRDMLTSWVEWLINVRKILKESARGHVGLLYGAVRYYPPYAGHDFSWCSNLLREIPCDPRSGIEERKLRKYLPYHVVANIPRMIRDVREKLPEGEPKKTALLARDELLILWLTILPWRQRNIRECRLEHNLFKRELPPMGGIETPSWVKERVRGNPSETFWQFDFREHSTKNGERVRAILPRQLVPPLEEYLARYRPLLLNGSDPGTLFVSQFGGRLDQAAVRHLIADITYRYTKTRVNPHLFRDIFAYRWLQDRPNDYLTLSKHLWHKDISTTLHCYGSKFDTSRAACAVEEWLDARK